MTPFVLFNIQFTFSLVVYALIAAWYVAPALRRRSVPDALVPLLLVHVFRYTPLTMLVPGQVASDVPVLVAQSIAYGDLAAAVFALIAVLMVRRGAGGATGAVWVFTIVGILDIGMAVVHGMAAHLYEYALGFNWYILNYYVPMLIVTHVLIIMQLRRRD